MHLGTNLMFMILYCVAVYTFYKSITMDPGYIRIPTKDLEISQVICLEFPMTSFDIVKRPSFNLQKMVF